MTPPAVTRTPLPTCPPECTAWQKPAGCGWLGTHLTCPRSTHNEAVRQVVVEQEQECNENPPA